MTYYLIMIMYIYIVCVFAWCALRMDKMWVSFSSTVTFRSFLFYFFFLQLTHAIHKTVTRWCAAIQIVMNEVNSGCASAASTTPCANICNDIHPKSAIINVLVAAANSIFVFIIFHSLVKYENLEKCIAFGPGERLCVMRWCDVDMEPYCIERKKNFGRLPSNLHDCQITYTDRRQSSPNKTI